MNRGRLSFSQARALTRVAMPGTGDALYRAGRRERAAGGGEAAENGVPPLFK